MRALFAAAICLTGCTQPSLDLGLDVGRRCTGVMVEVLDDSVLPGWTVHALAVLDDTGTTAWALATDPNKRLVLKPLPEGPELELTAIADDGVFDLVAGPSAGEAWLMFDGEHGARLWRLGDGALGEIKEAPGVPEFPAVDEPWSRKLVFIGTTPHVLAAPRMADASTLQLPLARVDRTTLAIVDAWSIEFWWTCADPPGAGDVPNGCQEQPYDVVSKIELLAVTQPDGAGETAVLIGLHGVETGATPDMDGLQHTVVSSLELQDAGDGGPPDAFRHDRISWVDVVPLSISPAQVAADADGLYVLAGAMQPPDTSLPAFTKDFLVSAEHAGGRDGGVNHIFAQVDKEYRSHLLQIGEQVALGQFLDGEWRVAPIVKNGELTQVLHELRADLPVADGSVARSAGFGQILVRPPDGPAQRVTLACVVDDT